MSLPICQSPPAPHQRQAGPPSVRDYLKARGVDMTSVRATEDVSYRRRVASRAGTLSYGQNAFSFILRGGNTVTLDDVPFSMAEIVRAG